MNALEQRVATTGHCRSSRRYLLLLLAALLLLGSTACGRAPARSPGAAARTTSSPGAGSTAETAVGSATPDVPTAAATPATVSAAPATSAPAATRAPTPPRTAVTAAPSAAPATGRLRGRTILLDPGHDGGIGADPARANALVEAGGFRKACNTSGTSTNAGYPEYAYNYDVVTRAAALLSARGATVVLTRHDDVGFGPCVNERAAIANAAHADAAVSVHADGGPAYGQGFHVIAPALAPDGGNAAFIDAGYQLALSVRTAFQAATAEPTANYVAQNGLDRRSDLAGLNLARLPAVFLECGNMRNDADAGRLTSPEWRQRAATGIADGIQAFLAPS